jgi:5-(carboxyamino)imidazole ribonucleotide mutase
MNNNPQVAIIMGSQSDEKVMQAAKSILNDMNISSEMTVVSAHRTPERMVQYSQSAAERGIQVIIAGAGGAAHLPGMVASLTNLPVIGVPIHSSNSMMGLDSLLSIVQMPGGVPVATVGVDNAKNAGLLAARILGLNSSEIQAKLSAFTIMQKDKVQKMIDDMKSSAQ